MTLDQFRRAAGISPALAERWYPHVLGAMARFHIDTPVRQADFIAQIGHESGGFTKVKESLNYSVQGLLATFPRSRISALDCQRLGRKPGEGALPEARQREIANKVYGGRYGNRQPNDGWNYRGRGLKQITFVDNYLKCGQALGLDLLRSPDLLLEDQWAAASAGWFWSYTGLSMYADVGDFRGQTEKINGGTNGLDDREARRKVARAVLLA